MPVKCKNGAKIKKNDLEQVSSVKGLLHVINICHNAI
jgi:hypothetical protein